MTWSGRHDLRQSPPRRPHKPAEPATWSTSCGSMTLAMTRRRPLAATTHRRQGTTDVRGDDGGRRYARPRCAPRPLPRVQDWVTIASLWLWQHGSTCMDRRSTMSTTTEPAEGPKDRTVDATRDERPQAPLRPDQRGERGTAMDAADIEGKAVISITTGARLGRVDDVLFDRGSLTVAAFRVSAD